MALSTYINFCSCLVQIVDIPKKVKIGSQSEAAAQVLVSFSPSKKKSFTRIGLIAFDRLKLDLFNFYEIGDFILVEGTIRIYKSKNSKRKSAYFIARRIYPFLLNDKEVIDDYSDYSNY